MCSCSGVHELKDQRCGCNSECPWAERGFFSLVLRRRLLCSVSSWSHGRYLMWCLQLQIFCTRSIFMMKRCAHGFKKHHETPTIYKWLLQTAQNVGNENNGDHSKRPLSLTQALSGAAWRSPLHFLFKVGALSSLWHCWRLTHSLLTRPRSGSRQPRKDSFLLIKPKHFSPLDFYWSCLCFKANRCGKCL